MTMKQVNHIRMDLPRRPDSNSEDMEHLPVFEDTDGDQWVERQVVVAALTDRHTENVNQATEIARTNGAISIAIEELESIRERLVNEELPVLNASGELTNAIRTLQTPSTEADQYAFELVLITAMQAFVEYIPHGAPDMIDSALRHGGLEDQCPPAKRSEIIDDLETKSKALAEMFRRQVKAGAIQVHNTQADAEAAAEASEDGGEVRSVGV